MKNQEKDFIEEFVKFAIEAKQTAEQMLFTEVNELQITLTLSDGREVKITTGKEN